MNVREMPDGKVLVICRAGCSNEQIIAATGLHWSALFPAPDNSPAEYRREVKRFPASDVLEALASEVTVAAVAAQNVAAGVELTQADRDRVMTAARRILRAREMANG
jgi:hypothetical protein